MALPDLFVIGAQKAGTTSLHHWLGQHPQVMMSRVKEPGFFSWLDWMDAQAGPGGDDGSSWRPGLSALAPPIRDRDSYESLFGDAPELRARFAGATAIGESTTDYLYSPHAAARVAELVPHGRIVVLLRQPAERAWSNWRHARREGREPLEDLEAALDAEEQRIADGWGPMWHYAAKSRYAPQLTRWMDRFPGCVHVALTEDLDVDPVGVCQGVFSFVGVVDDFLPNCRDRYNVGSAPAGLKAEGQLHRALVALGARVPWPYRRQIRDRLFPRPAMDPDLRARVTARFADDIAQTAQILGRDLSSWLP